MKKQWKWILPALALVIILPLAVLLYRNLSERYLRESTTTAAQTESSAEAAETTDVPESVSFAEITAPESTASSGNTDASAPTTTTTAPAPTTTTTTQKHEPPKELAADFTVYDENGSPVRLSEHFGKPLVVNFWASWCGPCCNELPAFNTASGQYSDKIEFMMVNLTDDYSETVSSVKEFVKENGYTFPVYFDTDESASNAYSIYSIPLTVFIRADGTVMDSHIGSMDEATLQSYLARLTA